MLDISLLVKTDSEWHRSLLLGVGQYSEDVGGWNFSIPKTDEHGEVYPTQSWNGDGILCRVTSERLEAKILTFGIPAVNVSWQQYSSQDKIPSVYSDEENCARMAAQFLLEKQYESFGYIGFPPWQCYSSLFEDTLNELFGQRGFQMKSFELQDEYRGTHGIDRDQLSTWLVELSKPTAIVVWNSAVGQLVTGICAEQQIAVPEKIAVLSIEHDPLWSALAPVPISYIDQDPWRVGYTAAKLLHSLIKGQSVPLEPIKINPISIVQRRSTEASAAKDPILDRAMKFIYDQAKCGITVKHVVDHVQVSRRGLEAKFRNELNCSPAAFIKRIQLQAVAKLLRTTKLNISAIAQQTGFAYPEVLMRAFKRVYGVTPMQFRGAGEVDRKKSTPPVKIS